jgi:hypothetical protein
MDGRSTGAPPLKSAHLSILLDEGSMLADASFPGEGDAQEMDRAMDGAGARNAEVPRPLDGVQEHRWMVLDLCGGHAG